MRELRIGTWLAALGALAAFGCDGGREPGDEDGGGMTMTDAGGGGGTDSGPPRDSGMMTMVDSGGGGGVSCGYSGPCDVTDPGSCGAGMACVLRVEEAGGPARPFCVAAGTGTDGTACDPMMAAQCAEGLDCSQFENVCRRNCCSDADCNPPGMITGQRCRLFTNAGPDPDNLAGVCVLPDSCNPVDGSGCAAGEGCYAIGAENECRTAGTVATGDSCADMNCAPGNACLDPAMPTCRKVCDLTMGGAGCPTGEACDGRIGIDGTTAREDVGYCVPME